MGQLVLPDGRSDHGDGVAASQAPRSIAVATSPPMLAPALMLFAAASQAAAAASHGDSGTPVDRAPGVAPATAAASSSASRSARASRAPAATRTTPATSATRPTTRPAASWSGTYELALRHGRAQRLPELRLLVRPRHSSATATCARTATAAASASRRFPLVDLFPRLQGLGAARPVRHRRRQPRRRSHPTSPRPAGRSRSSAPGSFYEWSFGQPLRRPHRRRAQPRVRRHLVASRSSSHGLVASAAARLLRRAVAARRDALFWYRPARDAPRTRSAWSARCSTASSASTRYVGEGGFSIVYGHARGPERAHRHQVPQAARRARLGAGRVVRQSLPRREPHPLQALAGQPAHRPQHRQRDHHRAGHERARARTRCSSGSRASRSREEFDRPARTRAARAGRWPRSSSCSTRPSTRWRTRTRRASCTATSTPATSFSPGPRPGRKLKVLDFGVAKILADSAIAIGPDGAHRRQRPHVRARVRRARAVRRERRRHRPVDGRLRDGARHARGAARSHGDGRRAPRRVRAQGARRRRTARRRERSASPWATRSRRCFARARGRPRSRSSDRATPASSGACSRTRMQVDARSGRPPHAPGRRQTPVTLRMKERLLARPEGAARCASSAARPALGERGLGSRAPRVPSAARAGRRRSQHRGASADDAAAEALAVSRRVHAAAERVRRSRGRRDPMRSAASAYRRRRRTRAPVALASPRRAAVAPSPAGAWRLAHVRRRGHPASSRVVLLVARRGCRRRLARLARSGSRAGAPRLVDLSTDRVPMTDPISRVPLRAREPRHPRRRQQPRPRVPRRRRHARLHRARRGRVPLGADGRAYLDYVGSWGPMILGHAHPAVVAAVQRRGGARARATARRPSSRCASPRRSARSTRRSR